MATEPAASGDLVFKPCARAFFVYYVALALVVLGPRLNPAVGLPVWLGTLLGVIVLAAVIYQKYGQEYRVTSRGVVLGLRLILIQGLQGTFEYARIGKTAFTIAQQGFAALF